jgi:hypothetical protein
MKKEFVTTKIYKDEESNQYYIIYKKHKLIIDPKNKQVHRLYKKVKPRAKKRKSEIDYLFKNKLAKNLKHRVLRGARITQSVRNYKALESEISNLKISKNDLEKKLKDEEEKFRKMQEEINKKENKPKKLVEQLKIEGQKVEVLENNLKKIVLTQEEFQKGLKQVERYLRKEIEEEKVGPLKHQLSEKQKDVYRLSDKNKIDKLTQAELISQIVLKNDREVKTQIKLKNKLQELYPQNYKEFYQKKDPNKLDKKVLTQNIFSNLENEEGSSEKEKKYFRVKNLIGKKATSEIYGFELFPAQIAENPELGKSSPSKSDIIEHIDNRSAEGRGPISLDGTTDIQLNEIMEGFPSFYGCVSSEKGLKKCLEMIEENFEDSPVHSFIYRLQSQEYPGGHWVAIWVDSESKEVCYYNSFGEPMPDELKVSLEDTLDKVEPAYYFDWKYNHHQIQPDKSELCGLYSTRVLTMLYYDVPWEEATGYLNKNIDKELGNAKHLLELDQPSQNTG